MDEYANTKGKFFSFLSQESTAIFNGDDPLSLKLISQSSAQTITYGINSELVTIKAAKITRNSGCTKFDVLIKESFLSNSGKKIKPASFAINLHCPGTHNIYNALLAIAACLALDLSIEEIQKGMDNFRGAPRRLEVIYNQEFKVINDVAHNPGSFQAVFATIREENFNHLYIVNSIRGNRGVEINRANTQVIIQWAKKLNFKKIFLTSAYDTCGPSDRVQEAELKTVLAMFKESEVEMEYHDGLKTSIENACLAVEKNDLLVFLGTYSMDNVVEIFQEIIKNK